MYYEIIRNIHAIGELRARAAVEVGNFAYCLGERYLS